MSPKWQARSSAPRSASFRPCVTPTISVPGEVLREDNRAVVCAASAASKAADFLLAFLPPAIDSVVEGNEEAA